MDAIDIERILAAKNPALRRRLPQFALRYLKRIVHQDEVNEALNAFGHLQGMDFLEAALRYLNVSYTLHGTEHIADMRRKLFVSNHPLGGFDGITLLHILGGRNADIKVVVNDLLMHIEPLRSFFLPVNKHGVQSREYVRQLQAAYGGDAPILYFPAGLCSRKIKGRIVDLEWKRSALKIACDYERDVVPVYFDGRNSRFFYTLARLRKFLGIKANIEMLYLVDELFKQRGARYSVYFGAPVSCKSLMQMRDLTAMTERMRRLVYALPQQNGISASLPPPANE